MKKEDLNIEKLYNQDTFEEFDVEFSRGLWAKISGKMRFRNFIKFRVSTFNVYYFATTLFIGTTALYFTTDSVNDIDDVNTIENIENNISVPEAIITDKDRKSGMEIVDTLVKVKSRNNKIKKNNKAQAKPEVVIITDTITRKVEIIDTVKTTLMLTDTIYIDDEEN